jgi:hypothetical protein
LFPENIPVQLVEIQVKSKRRGDQSAIRSRLRSSRKIPGVRGWTFVVLAV